MAGISEKIDLRIIKTHQALINAMIALLNNHKFKKISVNDLCEKALISRATFYVHFNDKYALLQYWMEKTREELFKNVGDFQATEIAVNQFIRENTHILTNIVEGADDEVLDLLHEFMYAVVDAAIVKGEDGQPNPNQVRLLNFCAGGMVSLLKWQVKNKFPPDELMVNSYFYQVLQRVAIWDSRH